MQIRNIRHKGLRQFAEENNPRGLPAASIEKIRDILTYLLEIDDPDEIMMLRKYKPHSLKGDKADSYSLHVTANWRLTFQVDAAANEIFDMDYEDYH